MNLKRIGNWVTEISARSWFNYGLIFLITLLAAVLRFYKLGEWSFWIDEIYTINHATSHFSSVELIFQHIPPARNWVPVSIILTAQTLNAWGVNEWSARLTSTVIGTLTIPILYMPTKRIFGNRVALIALLVLAITPWHIFWSQNARFYTALMLFYSLALFAFYFAIEQDRPLYFIGFYLLFYLAMSERLIAVLLLPVIFVYLLLLWLLPFEKPTGFNLRNVLILSAPLILFLIYEIYLFAVTGDFIFEIDLELLAPPIDNPIRLLIVIVFSIGIPVLCLAFLNGIFLFSKKSRAGLFFLTAAILPPTMIAMANPFFFIVERYAFVTLFFWIALAASGISALFAITNEHGIVLAFGVLFILVADAAGDDLLYYQINHGNRLEWRESVGYVQNRMDNGDVVVSTRAPLAGYYLSKDVLEFQELSPEDLETIDAPIWFIMDYPGIWHGRHDSKAWMEERAHLLHHTYLRVMEENTLLIYRFDPAQDTKP